MISQNFDENERWGDYIGLQRKFNEISTAWTAGYVSFGSQRAGTWISEVAMPIQIDSIVENGKTYYIVNGDTFTNLNGRLIALGVDEKPTSRTIVFPNPTADMVSVEFSLSSNQVVAAKLYDLNGRVVQQLLNQRAQAGKNVFTFNLAHFPQGLYVLQLESGEEIIHSEKLIRK